MKLKLVPAFWRLPLILVLFWAAVGCASPQDIWSIAYMEERLFDPNIPAQPCFGLQRAEACQLWSDGENSIVAYVDPGDDPFITFYLVHNGSTQWIEGDGLGYRVTSDAIKEADFLDIPIRAILEEAGIRIEAQIPTGYQISDFPTCLEGADDAIYMNPDFIATPHAWSEGTISVDVRLTGPGHVIWQDGNERLYLTIGFPAAIIEDYIGMQISYRSDENNEIPMATSDLPVVGHSITMSYGDGVETTVNNCGRGLFTYSTTGADDFVRPVSP